MNVEIVLTKHNNGKTQNKSGRNFPTEQVNVMAHSPKYMTYIHTYMTFYFFGKKSDVAMRVVEVDFGCEVDLKMKVSRKIKVNCPL